jgi:hypothetical protein
MRKEVIVLLAAASSIMGTAACRAGVTHDLRTLENTPRMIIWSICIAPRSGSALSIYSLAQKPMQSLQDVARREDVCSGCGDYADGGLDQNFIEAPRSADPEKAGPTWRECDSDGSDYASGLTGQMV